MNVSAISQTVSSLWTEVKNINPYMWLGIGIFVLCVLSGTVFLYHRMRVNDEWNQRGFVPVETMNSPVYQNEIASKCFDCEKETNHHYTSRKSKCFDCETELVSRNMDPTGGQPVKCFGCVRSVGNPGMPVVGGRTPNLSSI